MFEFVSYCYPVFPLTNLFQQTIGLLSAVERLTLTTTDEFAILNWIAPFTLALSITQFDITYCVEVVTLNCSSVLHSESCRIIETNFTYRLPLTYQCYTYNFTVTPVNPAGNGTKSSVQIFQGEFP